MAEPIVRSATAADLPAIVVMLADDPLGSWREDTSEPINDAYLAAFDAISADPNADVLVVDDGGVAGSLQINVIPNLSYRGGWRAQIESVRVATDRRGHGYGKLLLEAAVDVARTRGCHMVQLTMDKTRGETINFYESLGFVASHDGLKLHL